MHIKSLLLLIFLKIIASEYPKNFPRCAAGDVKCLAAVITETLKLAKSGNTELHLPRLDPLYIGTFDIERGGQAKRGAFKILMNFEKVEATGLSNAIVDKVVGFGADPHSSKFEIHVTIPKISLIGKYKMNGNVIILPINGAGRSNFTLDNIKVMLKFKPKTVEKDGELYLKGDKFKLNIRTSRLRMDFENLFSADPLLGETVNSFLNENWEGVLEEFKPVFIESLSKVFINILDSFFDHIPYKEIFAS